jgi:hypothetical protein
MTPKSSSLVFSLVLCSCLFASLAAGAEVDVPPQVRKVIGWLPEDTETLMVTKGSFSFSTLEEPTDEPDKLTNDERGARLRQKMQQLTIGHLHALGIAELSQGLQGMKVDLAIQGSRRFTSPRGLGSWLYEGCQIIQFHESANDAIAKAYEICQAHAAATVEIAGQTVAVFERRFEQDNWRFYVCQPQPGLLVCATNRRYLAEVLDRMENPSDTRAFPTDLPEWNHVDVKASVWGLRHYPKNRPEHDPLTPGRPDPGATGLTFWIPAAAKSVEVRFLTTNEEAVEILSANWTYPMYSMLPTVKQIEPGVVGVNCIFPTDFAEGGCLLILLCYLGHGVNL